MSDENLNPEAFSSEEQNYFANSGVVSEPPPGTTQDDDATGKSATEGTQGTESSAGDTGTAETAETSQQPTEQRTKTVPHQALHAEREEHRKTKVELDDIKQQMAIMNDRWNTLLKVSEKPAEAEQPDPMPDPNQDIFAFAQWQQRQLAKTGETVAQLQKRIDDEASQRQQVTEAQQQEHAVWNYWQQSAQQYAQENPDFQNAAQWLSSYRDKQLSALSIADQRFSTPQARNQQINAELKAIIAQAHQQRVNPADMVYRIAQGYGYTPAATTVTAEPEVTTQTAKQTSVEKIEKVAQAQAQSKTVGATAGQAGASDMTIDKLLSLPDREFEEWAANNKHRYRELLGG